ncbi:MAG: cytochrome c biogenesis protein CcsA [bacterium]
MKRISQIFLSMETMGFLSLVFAAAIGTATFIENDFGTSASKAVVYNAWWFNLLMLWLAANLIANIFRYRMYHKKKLAIFLFHISFLVILLGAGITRFISYEGMMHIREGESSSHITSDETYVRAWLKEGNESIYDEESVRLSVLTPKAYSSSASIGGKDFHFKTVKYIPNAREIITDIRTGGVPYMVVVASYGMGRQTFYFKYGTNRVLGPQNVHFGDQGKEGDTHIKVENGRLMIRTPDTLTTLSMMGGTNDTLLPGEWHAFEQRKLYQMPSLSLVLTNYYEQGGVDFVPYEGNDMTMMDALVLEVSSGGESKRVALRGGKGYEGESEEFKLNGVDITMTYGSKRINLPFSLELVDFQLERYPGSNSPSSYASEIVLVDERKDLREPHRIFMNNVLNYGGYRFFQSSYDRDELGTILSVNHDYWGTLFTYIGYFIMALGMFITPFTSGSRFAFLGRQLKKTALSSEGKATLILLALMTGSLMLTGQHTHGPINPDQIPEVDKTQAELFGKLMVQSQDGRLKPMNTLSSELLRKVARKDNMFGMTSDQVLLGMLSQGMTWQQAPMIKVSDDEVKRILGVTGKYASYMDFINMQQGSYKLRDYVQAAYAKKPAQRGMFDKEIIKVDERLNICYMVFTGDLLRMLPNPTDPYAPWFSPASKIEGVPAEDSIFLTGIFPSYLEAVANGNEALATELVNGISTYQKKYGAEIMPSERKLQMELTYNRLKIFDNLSKIYGLLGFIMLIMVFIEVFRKSLIYIGWVTMLAGLIFSRRSHMTLAATTVLTSIILMVAHLSWMDPEITNLVPVLKSYWLTIHVSIITASYGFLALGMLLGFINLILMILKSRKNGDRIDLKIKDLTAINERTMMIGLYMLTVGTFLGGVWANESWGRYWGWDPKETWALVSVLVYSFILHMQYIPGLKNYFSFNFASLIGYSSILMTYFGVNYYLSGLHSYAAGDPVPVPTFVYYTVAVVALVSIWAYINNRRFETVNREVAGK